MLFLHHNTVEHTNQQPICDGIELPVKKENGHPKMSVSFWWARRDLICILVREWTRRSTTKPPIRCTLPACSAGEARLDLRFRPGMDKSRFFGVPSPPVPTARRDLICILVREWTRMMVLPPSRPAASRCPQDICILMGSSPASKKKTDIRRCPFLFGGRGGT